MLLMLLRLDIWARCSLMIAHQAVTFQRTLTCTMRRATAGPDIQQALAKLEVTFLLHHCHRALCSSQEAGRQVCRVCDLQL